MPCLSQMHEMHKYPRALASSTMGKPNARAVGLGNFAHDGEPQPAAVCLVTEQAVETLENPLLLLKRNAWTIVLDDDQRLRGIR